MSPPARDSAPAGRTRRRGKFWWLKWLLGIALLALLVGEGIYLWPRLHESWRNLTQISWGWLAAAILAEAVSFSGFGRIQKQLLHSGGVEVSQRRSLAVVYAANSMSVTLPAGQVFATAFTYRQTRRWGATPIVASWQLAISGVIGAAGLALLGGGGTLLGVGSVSPYTLIFSLAGVVVLIWAGHYAATNPETIERIVTWAVTRVNRIRGHPDEHGMEKVREILDQLDSVDLNKGDAILTLIWTLGHRIGDVACLGFACLAIGADPSWAGLMIAFAAGKAVGTIPFAPGGIVYVDATLIAALTSAASMPAFQAVAAAFVYRLISFILVAIVGWVVFLFLFRRHHSTDLNLDAEIDAELEH